MTKNGFAVPTAKGYKNVVDALADIEMFHWPVIVKPTDSAGSKGVTRVDEPKDLERVFSMHFRILIQMSLSLKILLHSMVTPLIQIVFLLMVN